MWPLVVGLVLLAGAVVVMKIFERGSLPLNVGINGMTVGVVRGGVGDGVDRPAWRRVVDRVADRSRAPTSGVCWAPMFGATRCCSPSPPRCSRESASLAIGSQSMQLLGTKQVAAQKADRLPAALLIAAQSVLDQRDGQISDSTFELVAGAADGRSVSSRWRSTISSGALSRLVIGVTPGDWYSQALYEPTGEP